MRSFVFLTLLSLSATAFANTVTICLSRDQNRISYLAGSVRGVSAARVASLNLCQRRSPKPSTCQKIECDAFFVEQNVTEAQVPGILKTAMQLRNQKQTPAKPRGNSEVGQETEAERNASIQAAIAVVEELNRKQREAKIDELIREHEERKLRP